MPGPSEVTAGFRRCHQGFYGIPIKPRSSATLVLPRAIRADPLRGGFRKLVAIGIANQAVVPIRRLAEPEQMLQQPVHARGMKQVLTANYLSDALQGIVDHTER